MTAGEFKGNLEAAASELEKVVVGIFIKYRLTPVVANYLIVELAVRIAKHPINEEFERLKSIEN